MPPREFLLPDGGRYISECDQPISPPSLVLASRDVFLVRCIAPGTGRAIVDTEYALKLQRDVHREDARFLDRCRREADAPQRARAQSGENGAIASRHVVYIVHHSDYYDMDDSTALMYVIVMQLLPYSLNELLGTANGSLPSRQAISLAITLAEAVHACHATPGDPIVHRDLSLSNIRLLVCDPIGPGACEIGSDFYIPVLIDFGLARLPNSEAVSGDVTRSRAGTDPYMAPEQFAPEGRILREPMDVYALGVILYRLLTGDFPIQEPHDQNTTTQPPAKIEGHYFHAEQNCDQLADRLNRICYHCLRKRPEARPSAAQLAADLRAVYASGAPLHAPEITPVSITEDEEEYNVLLRNTREQARQQAKQARQQAKLFWRRLMGMGGVVAFVVILLGISITFWRLAERATEAEKNGKIHLLTDQGTLALSRYNPAVAAFHLTHALELTDPEAADQRHALRTEIATAHDSLHRLEDVVSGDGQFRAAAASPRGGEFALVNEHGTVYLYDLINRKTRPKTLGKGNDNDSSLAAVAYTPDGRSIVAAANNGWVYRVNVKTLESESLFQMNGKPFALAVQCKDPFAIAVGGLASLTVRELSTAHLPVHAPPAPGRVDAVAFSPDGTRLAASGHLDNKLRVWGVEQDGAKWVEQFATISHPGPVFAVVFSSDGATVITGCIDGRIRFWDANTGRSLGVPLQHSFPVRALAYRGDLLASGAEDGTARVWDVGLRAPVGQPLYHLADVRGVAFTPDGRHLVTAGNDGAARIWRICPRDTVSILRHPPGAGIAAIAYSKDGSSIITGCRDSETQQKGAVRLWSKTGDLIRTFNQNGEALAVGFAPGRVFGAGNDGHVRTWNLDGEAQHITPDFKNFDVVYSATAGGLDDRYVAFSGRGNWIRLLDLHTGETHGWEGPKDTSWVWTVSFSPDGSRLLTNGRSGCRLWKVPSGEQIGNAMTLDDNVEVRWSAFSRYSSRILGCGYSKGQVGVWDGNSNRLQTFSGHQGRVYSGDFHPKDPDIIVTAGADHTARMWDVRTGKQRGIPLHHEGKVLTVAFSPDGKTVATGCEDGTARVWSITGEVGVWQGAILHHQGPVTRIVYRPDLGDNEPVQILTGSNDGTARLWTLPEPASDDHVRLRLRLEVDTGMTPDEHSPADPSATILSGEGPLRVLGPEEWENKRDKLAKE